MKERPNYYAIIPAEVRYCEDLPSNAKLLYGEITALASTDGGCFARNKYFANLYHVDVRTVQNWLEMLEEKGFIERTSARMSDTGLRAIRVIDRVRPHRIESYNEIFAGCGVDGELKRVFIEFIKHCNLNGKIVTNAKLYDIIVRLDVVHGTDDTAKINSLQTAICKGYFDVAEQM